MSAYFSIGEMSKLSNISIQTLRHYDKIGLLRPTYTNEKTGYRYYSIKHFIAIDLIKQCKAMGLSLDEIKELIGNYTSLESVISILSKQEKVIDEKIRELSNIKNNISYLENRIKDSLDKGFNKVFIKYNKERNYIKYNYGSRFTDEFEMNLRKALLDMEKKYSSFISELAFVTSYSQVKNGEELKYDSLLLNIIKDTPHNEKNVVTLPEGHYLTLYFDDSYEENRKYFNIIMDYIEEHNIEVQGDFYEVYIMTRVGNDGKDKSLAQVEILIKDT